MAVTSGCRPVTEPTTDLSRPVTAPTVILAVAGLCSVTGPTSLVAKEGRKASEKVLNLVVSCIFFPLFVSRLHRFTDDVLGYVARLA